MQCKRLPHKRTLTTTTLPHQRANVSHSPPLHSHAVRPSTQALVSSVKAAHKVAVGRREDGLEGIQAGAAA